MNVFSRAAALAAACAAMGAHAVDVVAGIGLNYKNIDMSFRQDMRVRPVSGTDPRLSGTVSQDMAFDAWQPFLQGNVAIVSGDYYVAVNGETDVQDEGSDIKVDQVRSDGLAVNLADPHYVDKDVDVSRDDFGVTIGWRGIERVALFGGFKYGKTDFDGVVAREFVAYGPLLGASYSIPFDASVLTLGGAFARLSGTYDESDSVLLLAEEIDGDANGFSAFINWSAPLTQHLRYLVELRWQRYDFDGDDSLNCRCANRLFDPSTQIHLDKDFSVRETLYGAGVGIVYSL